MKRDVISLQQLRRLRPHQRLGIDFVGPFPQSRRGNRYLLVLVDFFTKWAEAIPLPNQEVVAVPQAIYNQRCASLVPRVQSTQTKAPTLKATSTEHSVPPWAQTRPAQLLTTPAHMTLGCHNLNMSLCNTDAGMCLRKSTCWPWVATCNA